MNYTPQPAMHAMGACPMCQEAIARFGSGVSW